MSTDQERRYTKRTFVARLLESRFGYFQRPLDRWVGNDDAIIPHDCKAQILARSMVREIVFFFVPFLPNRKRVFEPRFSIGDSFHEGFDPADAVGHRTEHGGNRVLALERVEGTA